MNKIEQRCPLCQKNNHCSGDRNCWCMDDSVKFSPRLLQKIPPDSRGTRCICRACVLAEKKRKNHE